jgi:RNA polymerase sigma-70 factor (ECF subfamily)
MNRSYEQGKELSDKELRECLAADLEGHFELLAKKYVNRLYKYALRKTRNEEDAADVVQDTLIKAFAALKNYSPAYILTMNLQAWLFTIAYHVFVDLYHDRKRLPSVPIDTSEESSHLYLEADPDDQPDIVLERAEQNGEILEAIYRLPPAYQKVAFLYFIEKVSPAKIAEKLNIPWNTVKSNIHRSKGLLRKALAISMPKASEASKKEEK